MSSGNHLSKEFFELVKSIGESRSKQEEDKIISYEVRQLKVKMAAPDVPSKKMKEYLIRMIYVEMLGHDASFGHIQSVKMVSRSKLLEKRCGYLAVSLCLHSGHSFMLLLINSLQTDLKSDNFLEVSMALTVVCKMVNRETIPALLPLVIKLLEHKQPNIRKKAVLALARFHQIEPSSVASYNDKVRKVLCDKDPAVMGASLCLLYDMAVANAQPFKDLVPSFVSILKQVTEHRLPRDYDYHRMPAPWIQLKLLQILAVLGANDRAASEGMYEILHEVMKRANIGINVGYAIVYECVRTVTTIYPDNALIEDASLSIAQFITSDNHNLKYLGVNSLAAIVQINPKYAAEHQLTVIDCLEDPDETLKRKTLDLLYSMTNPQNVVVIVEKLTNFLRTTTDVYLRTELVSRVNQLAEKFAPNSQWYITTLNSIFELGGDLVRPEVAHSLMRLIAESSAHEGTAQDVRVYAVDTYFALLNNQKQLSDILLQVIAWVLGEFGHLAANHTNRTELVMRLIQTMDGSRHFDSPTTRSWILSAIMKLSAHWTAGGNALPKEVKDAVVRYQSSVFVDLQQRAHEFNELLKAPRTMQAVLPVDASTESFNVDSQLSFLNAYVETALKAGAQPYQSKEKRDAAEAVAESKHKKDDKKGENKQKSLSFTPYANPQANQVPAATAAPGGAGFANPKTEEPAAPAIAKINLTAGSQKRWGADMFDEKKAAAAPASNPSAGGGSHADPYGSPAHVAPSPQHPIQTLTEPPVQQHDEPRKKPAPKPVQPTEKELRARELFAGLVPGSTAAAAPAPVAAPVHRPAAQPVSAPTPVAAPKPANPDIDLFGMFGTGAAAPAAQPVHTPAPVAAGGGGGGGLDSLFDLSGVKPAAAPAPTAASSLFGGMTVSKPQPTAAASNDLSAMFGGGGGGGGGALDIFGDNKPNDYKSQSRGGSNAMSPAISQKLNGLRRVPAVGQSDLQLASNAALSVSYIKAFAPEKTVVAVFLTNANNSGLSDVTVQLELPSGMSVNFDGDGTGKGAAFVVSKIAPGATATALLYLSCVNTSIAAKLKDAAGSASAIGVAVTYAGSGSSPVRGSVSLDLSDLLRPAPMTTDRFGAQWKSFPHEKKWVVASTSISTPAEFVTRARDAFGIYHVQMINTENICAGKLVSPASQDNTICLVHGRVKSAAGGSAKSLEITVRTQSPDFTALVQTLANQVFSS